MARAGAYHARGDLARSIARARLRRALDRACRGDYIASRYEITSPGRGANAQARTRAGAHAVLAQHRLPRAGRAAAPDPAFSRVQRTRSARGRHRTAAASAVARAQRST